MQIETGNLDTIPRLYWASFRQAYPGDEHLHLACHAAFPIALTTDLLYKIWLNFRKTTTTEDPLELLSTVSDLLHSDLFREVGRDMYEMQADIRELLISTLQTSEAFGEARVFELARFLRDYLQYNPEKIPTLAFKEAQSWLVASYLEPEKAAKLILDLLQQEEENPDAGIKIDYFLSWAKERNKLNQVSGSAGDALLTAEQMVLGIRQYKAGDLEGALERLKPFLGLLTEGEEKIGKGFKTKIPTEVWNALQLDVPKANKGRDSELVLQLIENERQERGGYLDLGHCELSEIPKELSTFEWLEVLILSENENLKDLNPLSKLSNLRKLHISNTLVNDLTPLRLLSKLTFLDISKTYVKDLKPLASLTSLYSLNISNTKVNDLIPLVSLTNLTLLNLSNTEVSDLRPIKQLIFNGIPVQQKWTSNPNGIIVEGCPLIYPPIEIVQNDLPTVLEFFNKIDETHQLNEVRVFLLGEGGTGKTRLIKQLLQQNSDQKGSQTEGIRITKQRFKHQGQDLLVHFWDFGGQEIMHATHQFFLTKRCLYILVLDSRNVEKTEYWLNYIESFGGTSPVIVVLDRDKNPTFNVNRNFISKKYPRIQDFYELPNDETGFNELKEDLLKHFWNMELREYTLPKSWANTKMALEEMQEDFIGYSQYQKICWEKDVKDEASQKVLLELLNDLGVVINYENLRWFDTQVLNPHWLTNAVYRIINSPILTQSNGRFNINDLDAIINDEYYREESPENWENISKSWKLEQKFKKFPEEKFLFIVAMMRQFEILFQLDNFHYLVPALLPDEEQSQSFSEENEVIFFMIEYRDFLPATIIPRLMVKLHKYIYQEQCWKTGMVLEEKTLFYSIAKIVMDKEGRKINIEVKGERNRDFLSVIRETIKEINSIYQNLNVIEWVPLPSEYKSKPVLVKYMELQGHERAHQKQFFSGELQESFQVSTLLNKIEKPEIRKGLRPCHIFISYAQQDQKFKEKLLEHLSPLFRLNRVSLWDDNCIDAGEEWLNEIYENLEKAHVVLCLISGSFINSDFCYSKELTQALEAHDLGKKVVVPIRIKEVNWDNLKISQLQSFPKNKWVRNLSDHKSWTDIAKGIEVAIDKITRRN
ncbi:COR domain-containing protein [Haliscomenobacter sp.]|uniref:COR domain-containing protein n=1 Tax=Haliscomenobacter sp. TaxID=2717303 RepID=UPI003BAA3420